MPPSGIEPTRLLLRVEILSSRWNVVGHTVEIADSWIFVKTRETASIGDQMTVRLSFPGLLEPLELAGHVVSQMLPSEPGDPHGLRLALVFRSEAEERQLRDLLAQLDDDTAAARAARNGRAYRLLVVEDSKLIADAFAFAASRFFAARHKRVLADFAATVDEAVDLIGSATYDLAIVDYFLPGRLGDELIALLRRDPARAAMPIIAVSVGGETARRASLSAGADLFLDKPLVLRDLFVTIEQLAP